jgi:hypothetical protein
MGKYEIEELMAERAADLGEAFTLKRFMDEIEASGLIPVSLIRWEMTGRDDEIREITLLLASLCLTGCIEKQGNQRGAHQAGARSAEIEALQSQVDQVREEFDLPALVVALAEGGDPPIVAASGYADLDREVQADPDTPFFIGSISKNLFTTVALLLAEEGVLSLEDPLSDYLDWPRGDEITVRMLLNHTTGIPDYFGSLGLPGGGSGVPDFFSRPRPPSEIFEMMPARAPAFDPGSDQAYRAAAGGRVPGAYHLSSGSGEHLPLRREDGGLAPGPGVLRPAGVGPGVRGVGGLFVRGRRPSQLCGRQHRGQRSGPPSIPFGPP